MVRGGWGALFLLALGGCVVVVPADGTSWPLPLVQALRQEALRELPTEGVHVEPRNFANSLEDFGAYVARLASLSVPPSDDDMARALEALSLVLQTIPRNELAATADRAADMRQAAGHMRIAGPPGSLPVQESFLFGFRTGIRTLLDIARASYGDDPEVRARAEELEGLFDTALEYEERLSYDLAVAILRRAVFLLNAISQAESIAQRSF